MTSTRQTEVVDPIEIGTWVKTAVTADPDKNKYVCVGTLDPQTATLRAIVVFGDAEPAEGTSQNAPQGFDYQFEFTLTQNLGVTLLLFSTSEGETDVEQITTTTGPTN